ncbi:MAG: hypothetical protein V1814_01930 [Candidatus Moraniibacteriota bacterium]
MGFIHYDPKPMTEAEAKEILSMGANFDYLKGRVMKIDLSKDEVNTWGYNRDNGPEAAENAVAELRKSSQVITPAIEATHKANTRVAAAEVMAHLNEETTTRAGRGMHIMTLGFSDMAHHLRPAIKKAKKGLNKPMAITVKMPPKTTFKPLTGGKFKCNQTGDIVKAGHTQSYARARANSAR